MHLALNKIGGILTLNFFNKYLVSLLTSDKIIAFALTFKAFFKLAYAMALTTLSQSGFLCPIT